MSIGLMFGELTLTSALRDTKTQIQRLLGSRTQLAEQLDQQLISENIALDDGSVLPVTKEVSDWTTYYQEDGGVLGQLARLFTTQASLETQLDRIERSRQQLRVSTQNAIAQSNLY